MPLLSLQRFKSRHLVLFSCFVVLLYLIGCSSPPAPPPASTATPNTEAEAAEQEPETTPLETAVSEPTTESQSGSTTGIQIDSSAIPGRIVFISSLGQLGTIDPNGERLRILANDGIYQFPAWSPTSNQIAAIGSSRDGNGVYVTTDEDNNTLIPLYNDSSPIYLYWAPDGKNLSFIAQHREGLALHITAADGLSESAVLSTGQPLYWQWSPNQQGQALTHVGRGTLAYVDIDGNHNQTELGGGGIFQAPALSANGQYLAYSQPVDTQNRQIAIYDVDQAEQIYEQPHAGVLAMSWSPAADKLAYISPAEDRAVFFGPLRIFDAMTGESEVAISSDVLLFFWSPDGRSILYFTLRDADGQQAQASKMRLSKTAAKQEMAFFTAFVYDIASGRSRSVLTFQPTYLFVSQFLPFFDQYALSHRVWSPDSRYVVIPTLADEQKNNIMVVPVNGDPPIVITEGIIAFWSHE